MAHPSDYKVAYRSEAQIAAIAHRFRERLGVDSDLTFDPFAAIKFLSEYDYTGKGLLQMRFFNAPAGCPPARVKFENGRILLFVDNEVWNEAKIRVPDAISILNHEIGHILLHDHSAQAFSADESKRLKSFQQEERAEWQADTFMDHVSLPLRMIMGSGGSVAQLAIRHNVTRAIVERQIRSVKLLRKYSGDACPECANFTLVRNGTCLKCDTCGSTTGCS